MLDFFVLIAFHPSYHQGFTYHLAWGDTMYSHCNEEPVSNATAAA